MLPEITHYAAYPDNKPIVLSVTDTAARFEIPARIRGKLCAFLSDGADCDVLFGGSTVAAVYGQASTVNTQVITEHTQSGGHLVSKVEKLVRVPKDPGITHFSVDCVGSGTAKLYIEIID
jgi:hypothetical protein